MRHAVLRGGTAFFFFCLSSTLLDQEIQAERDALLAVLRGAIEPIRRIAEA